MPEFRIPIEFVREDGSPCAPTPARGAIPVVRVIFRHSPTGPILPKQPHEREVLALVDTGADLNYATQDLVDQVGAPIIASSTVRGATSSITSTHRSCHIFVPSVGLQLTTEVSVAPLREVERCYDVILGRDTIELGRLEMDYRKGAFWLILGRNG